MNDDMKVEHVPFIRKKVELSYCEFWVVQVSLVLSSL